MTTIIDRDINVIALSLATLSEAEADVLLYMMRGMSSVAEIAALRYVAISTVKNQRARLYAKLDVDDAVQAVVIAWRCHSAGFGIDPFEGEH